MRFLIIFLNHELVIELCQMFFLYLVRWSIFHVLLGYIILLIVTTSRFQWLKPIQLFIYHSWHSPSVLVRWWDFLHLVVQEPRLFLASCFPICWVLQQILYVGQRWQMSLLLAFYWQGLITWSHLVVRWLGSVMVFPGGKGEQIDGESINLFHNAWMVVIVPVRWKIFWLWTIFYYIIIYS